MGKQRQLLPWHCPSPLWAALSSLGAEGAELTREGEDSTSSTGKSLQGVSRISSWEEKPSGGLSRLRVRARSKPLPADVCVTSGCPEQSLLRASGPGCDAPEESPCS